MARRVRNVTVPATPVATVIDETALTTGVVTAPVVETTALALIGDNSQHASDPLPSPTELHAAFEAAVAVVAKHGAALEHAQQRVAFLMLQRQAVRIANGETTVSLAACVTNAELRKAYLAELVDEYAGTAISTRKATDATQMHRGLSRQTFRARVERSLSLATAIAANGGDYTDFDHDKGRFRAKPSQFIAHGYVMSQELRFLPDSLLEGATPVEREYVWLADDDTSQTYYCKKPGLAEIPINMSVRQYLHALSTRIEAAAKAGNGETAPPAEPTAGRQQRSAQQASGRSELERKQAELDKAKREADQLKADAAAAQVKASNLGVEIADAKVAEQASIDSDATLAETPTTDDTQTAFDRDVADWNACMVKLASICERDHMHNMTWEHVTPDAKVATDMAGVFIGRLLRDDAAKQEADKAAA